MVFTRLGVVLLVRLLLLPSIAVLSGRPFIKAHGTGGVKGWWGEGSPHVAQLVLNSLRYPLFFRWFGTFSWSCQVWCTTCKRVLSCVRHACVSFWVVSCSCLSLSVRSNSCNACGCMQLRLAVASICVVRSFLRVCAFTRCTMYDCTECIHVKEEVPCV